MPQLNLAAKEITLKIVYYGPALSGKTTNLQQIHAAMTDAARGEMVILDTQDDRTLYFDFLPVEFGTSADYLIKLKLFTVPGQVMHKSTRKVVLANCDAVAFVADSQRSSASANAYSWRDMEANLRSNGIDFDTIPKVVQFNKRDLPNVAPVEYMDFLLNQREKKALFYETVAFRGDGVHESLNMTCKMVMAQFIEENNIKVDKANISDEAGIALKD